MATGAHHFFSSRLILLLLLHRILHHPQRLETFLALRIPLVSYVLGVFAAGWLSVSGRSPWVMRRLLVDVGLGCTKGRRIASTYLSLELAAASAGDRI